MQRDGLLRGPTLNIDTRLYGQYNGQTWVGTPLGDVSGYVALIERSIGELTTPGGTVRLSAGGSIVLQQGAKIDVSGGFINYQAGLVPVTRVISDGFVYTLDQATPDRIYSGIYDGTFTVTSLAYGLSQTYSHPLSLPGTRWEDRYTQGVRGGSISLTAPSMALDGQLLGQTISGERQRVAPPAGQLGSHCLSGAGPRQCRLPGVFAYAAFRGHPEWGREAGG